MNPNFRSQSLYYFIVAAEEMNITKAANKLFITQQSLSKHIQKLERDYESVFFTRSPRLRLTWEGEHMLDYAKKTIAQEKKLLENFRDKGKAGRIKLPICVVSMRAKVFLPEILIAYHNMHSNVVVTTQQSNYRDADYLLRTGDIDLYFGIADEAGGYGSRVRILTDELYFVASEDLIRQVLPFKWDDFIRKQKEGVDINDVVQFPLILPPAKSTFRILLDKHFGEIDCQPLTVAEISEYEVLLSLCKQGFGAGFVSKPLLYTIRHELRNNPFLIFPIKQKMELATLDVVYNDGANPPRRVVDFIQCARKTIIETSLQIDDFLKNRLKETK